MPNPALLQAINRLDQAIGRAEAAFQQAQTQARQRDERRDAIITEAMTELDGLISALRESEHG